MRQGDLVTRRSYGGDIVFRIEILDQHRTILRGIEYRLLADAPLNDLTAIDAAEYFDSPRSETDNSIEIIHRLKVYRTKTMYRPQHQTTGDYSNKQGNYLFEMPGKVLHLDGDPAYLRKCMKIYGDLKVPVDGFYIPESQMADALHRLLPQLRPEIVVITGHDGILKNNRATDMNNLNSYKNSLNFVKAVQVAREYEKNRDALTVIAGACQSHFEALVHAGANFASSPGRVLIHALDPLCIAAQMSYTSIKETFSMSDLTKVTLTGLDGIGGVETRGSHRMGIPRMQGTAK